ncbi:hypothetical protein DFR55_10783 [Herbinix hemicellulosilytica]|uniref:Tetratricopeptide repeat protein n=1 Tax=Herbinix hemicellulosilytica TaxID=1564487 RepID=A0A0H5SY83_HERHM|nr:hypothetical protein [Herbinix hemicellulosilytica]RBP59214.1 hypothetical protein DFR55_10783 [Herbinix hemicellulosilytica]CRZ35343.1 hypothetical protein HHT355_2145 [Herbinix hemicellulosilytica]
MGFFVTFGIVIIFVLWLNYEIRKNNRLAKKSSEEFWEKEANANMSRKTDISNLDYIRIPYEKLPLNDTPDDTINFYRDTILSQSDKKILNLSGFSNTELKLKYGAANLSKLSEYDNNFTVLVATLHKWGERLYQQGYHNEALAVLEAAVDCKSDVRKTYELLAQIYMAHGSPDKIDNLIDAINRINIAGKENLVLKLNNIKNKI